MNIGRLKIYNESPFLEKYEPEFEKLTLPNGCMWWYYNATKCDSVSNSYVYYVKDEDKIIAWSIKFGYKDWKYNRRQEGLMLFVHPNYRRKGIGTKLINRIKNDFDISFYVSSWDDISTGFFEKNRERLEETDF